MKRVLPLLAATFTLSAGVAYAAPPEREDDAERLFREGQKLLEERRYGEACPKFEAAYRKDGKLGTLINLAFCHQEQGATWYAWLEYREAEVKAIEQNRSDRRDFVRKNLAELEKPLARAIVDNPRREPLLEVLVEERRIPEAERGASFSVEPGQRKVTFRAKGKKQTVVMVAFAREKTTHVAVPEMAEQKPEDIAPSVAPRVAKPPVDDGGSSQRLFGYVALGVAGAAFVTGGITGVMTLTNPCSDNFLHDREPGCELTSRRDDYDRGAATGLVASLSFGIAAVAGIGGLVLLLTAPSAPERTSRRVVPVIGAGYAGLAGAF